MWNAGIKVRWNAESVQNAECKTHAECGKHVECRKCAECRMQEARSSAECGGGKLEGNQSEQELE